MARKPKNKTELRKRILKAFTGVLFFSYLFTGIIFNIAIRFSTSVDERYLIVEQGTAGRAGMTLIVLVGIMFVVSVIATYFLSNSITRPIEQLEKFALGIGKGNFEANNFEFTAIELENLNAALNKSVRQLEAYDREQKAFFQNASHELRTPLMSIQCHAEGISFGLMDSKEASETILQETHRLSDLVTDLLYISKIDNITTVYTAAKINLLEILRLCAERQKTKKKKKGVKFIFDFDKSAVEYECVDELISRSLDNLISNAIRYAESEITLSCHKKQKQIIISVTDDGNGIAEESIPHVFERFYKGSDGNHGIGLSIVKSVVEQHKGSITVKNTERGGAVFTMTLPLITRG
jgi:signal transduction histidine kinase